MVPVRRGSGDPADGRSVGPLGLFRGVGVRRGMVDDVVLSWLLEEEQPGVRYRTLTELLGRAPSDPEVRKAKQRIPTVGWAADLLNERAPWGGWEAEGKLYTPKYAATTWKMLALADLGLDWSCPTFRRSIELWADRFTQSSLADQLLGSGIAGPADLRSFAAAWRRWAASPDGWFAVLHGEVLCTV